MRVDIHRREKPRVKNPRGSPPTLQDERRAKANPMGRRALRLILNMGDAPDEGVEEADGDEGDGEDGRVAE